MNNFTNANPSDPHRFKEELKIKYEAVLAVVGKFPNGTGPMLELLKAETVSLDWAAYCVMSVANQEIWEAKGDAFTKAMLFLMNSKNDAAKKDVCLSYSQGNKKAYLETAESMARYLSTQYNNKVPNNPCEKRVVETQRRVTIANLKTAILPLRGLLVQTLGKSQHLKIQQLLAKGLVLVLTYLKCHNQHFVRLNQ